MEINSENDAVTDLILHLRMNLTHVEVKKKKHNLLLIKKTNKRSNRILDQPQRYHNTNKRIWKRRLGQKY